jgi:hypothetical protein
MRRKSKRVTLEAQVTDAAEKKGKETLLFVGMRKSKVVEGFELSLEE